MCSPKDWSKSLFVSIVALLVVSCGQSDFFNGETTANSIDGQPNELNSDAVGHRGGASESRPTDSGENGPSDDSDDIDEADEEIVAVRPVVISGSYLACTVPVDREGSMFCSFEKDQEPVDLSMYPVEFMLHNGAAFQKLEYVLRDDKVTYEFSDYPASIDLTLIEAVIEIDGVKHTIKELKISETAENSDGQAGDLGFDGFEDIAMFTSCDGILGTDDVATITEDDIIQIASAEDLEGLALTQKSILVVQASGNNSLDLNLDGVEQIRGVCINASGSSSITVNSSAHINRLVVESSGGSNAEVNFATGKVFNTGSADVSGGGIFNLSGASIDCDRLSLVSVNGGGAFQCSNK